MQGTKSTAICNSYVVGDGVCASVARSRLRGYEVEMIWRILCRIPASSRSFISGSSPLRICGARERFAVLQLYFLLGNRFLRVYVRMGDDYIKV